LEILIPNPAPGRLRQAVFDFDGTLSLVRTGWQQVMADQMADALRATPGIQAGSYDEARLQALTHEAIYGLAGRPTIVQMEWLAETVREAGGSPLPAEAYKTEYQTLLSTRVHHLADLRAGLVPAADLRVPGSLEFVSALAARGVICSIASGTDEQAVREEAEALGFTPFITEIRGARSDGLDAKRVLIDRLTAEHQLAPGELAAFGDGRMEMLCARSAGGLAVGVASNEFERQGINAQKRGVLMAAGADAIVPDFSNATALLDYFFPAG
jgi:phosphoglycolate phosphatase-like HAD superfamily hydrolase